MSRSVIHIGANKTGSTTLQRWLFARSDDLLYLGEDCNGYGEFREILDSVVHDDDIHYPRTKAEELFSRYRAMAGAKTFVYSNEDIMRSRVPVQCARRLHQLLPGARILAVLRNQLTAVPSWYANHGAYLKMVPRRYWRRHVSFDEWMEYCIAFLKYSPLDGFFYHRILCVYAELFGKDRIDILLYEDFVEQPQRFIGDLSRMIGLEAEEAATLLAGKRERSRNTARRLRYNRLRSRLLWGVALSRYLPLGRTLSWRWQRFLDAGPKVGDTMPKRWRSVVAELYAQDNALLTREFGVDLAKYGYPLVRDPSGAGDDGSNDTQPSRADAASGRSLPPSVATAG